MNGIDISKHQAGLNLANVKNAGRDFVILRGSYTGYGANRTKNKDSSFENFYQNAKANGLKVGAYHYSCATNKAEGIAEANFIYDNCLKGKQFEMPIYIDVEEQRWQANNKNGVTDAIIGFCETLESKGYYVGIYASLDWFKNKIDTARLEAYSKWVACWTNNQPQFNYKGFEMWQNSDGGVVAGTKVDTDVAFVDFESIIKSHGLNGYSKGTNLNTLPQPTRKSVDEIAREVIAGQWGDGQARKTKLSNAGYNYDEVQSRVNAILGTAPKKTTTVITYKVKSGDNLTKIAKMYGTTVDAIAKKNGIKNKNKIYVGQVLRI